MNDQSENVPRIPLIIKTEPVLFRVPISRLISISFLLSPVVYAALHRTIEDFLFYGSLASAFFLVAFTVFASGLKRPTLLRWRGWIFIFTHSLSSVFTEVFLFSLSAVFTGVLFYSLSVAFKDAALYVVDAGSFRNGSIVLSTVLVLAVAALLFYVRLRYRVLYGLSEVAVGISVAVSRLTTPEGAAPRDADFYLAMLTAGVYLIIRGLDNVHSGWTQIKEIRAKSGVSLLSAIFGRLAK